jgi:hypothetical protein
MQCKKTLLIVKNMGCRLGVLGIRRKISQFCLEQADVGIWSSKAMVI